MSGTKRPIYVRILRLCRLNPPSWLCFVLLEGSVLFGLLLALSELVIWEVGVAVPLAVAAAVKLVDVVLVSQADSAPAESTPTAMRASVAAVRAQQRSGAAARSSSPGKAVVAAGVGATSSGSPATSLVTRERNRKVVRGVAAVPSSARMRPRLSRGSRVVGAWPMPVETAGDSARSAVWHGPTVGMASGAPDIGPGMDVGPGTGAGSAPDVADEVGSAGRVTVPPSGERRSRNEGRFAARRRL